MTEPRDLHEFPEIESLVNRDLMTQIAKRLPPLMGFAIFVFDFGPGGRLAYGSNAQRADMIAATKEWLRKQGETTL